MHRFVRPLALTALAMCCGAALASTPADQAPHGTLPRWAVPQSYQLSFKVDPKQQDYSGGWTVAI
jgi:alanyl aminopeptidase